MADDTSGKADDTMGSAPTVDTDTAGRGGYDLEGESGIHVVKSIGQGDWLDYSNQSKHPNGGSD